jgi:hypothetical protein
MVRPPRPAMQGDLDGLCGVYSIVNAVQWALHTCPTTAWAFGQAPKRLIWAEQEALFDTLVTALGRRRPLASFVTGGINSLELTRLLRVSREWLSIHRNANLVCRRPFYRRRTIAPRSVLACLREHLAAPGSAAIIAVEAHWTVVRAAAKRRVRVMDSGGWMFMTMGRKAHRGARRNGFQPSSVFVLRLTSQAGTQAERP